MVLTAMFAFSACSRSGGGEGEESAEPAAKVLSDQELVEIAFKDAGFEPIAGEDITIFPDNGTGKRNVSFKIGNAEYSYDIDVNTGEIVNCVKPDIAPDVEIDYAEIAMDMVEQLPEFKDATNVNIVQNGDKYIITFDSDTGSYKYEFDPDELSLERK